MQQALRTTNMSTSVSAFFARAALPSQQETLGSVALEILRSGRTLNRKALCMQLLARIDTATSVEEEMHLQELIGLLFCE
ncbi:regulatory protein YcgZ [Erwinia sp. 198]|uniref:regulatory protein YcgZ n=1 Tax=Erwinia sp. 198 TaxID=2022746 RepID=UPI000F66CFAA|nr:regulatory protein YcgZ [Erwinia sp. 198]RRZ90374.1 hypothetical protein EGK14_14385 [Erwinia sp. 198]